MKKSLANGILSEQRQDCSLIISADSHWLEFIEPILKTFGLSVIKTPLRESKQLLGSLQCKLVIIDMEELSAKEEWTQKVQEIKGHQPGSFIVVVSSAPTWKRIRAAFLAGANEVLTKSANESEWRECILKIKGKEERNEEDQNTFGR